MPNPGAAEDFLATINPESLVIKQGFVEPSLAAAQPQKAVSVRARRLLLRWTAVYSQPSEKPVFNRTVGLRDTWAKIGE